MTASGIGVKIGSLERKTNATETYSWSLTGSQGADGDKITRAIWIWDANPKAVAETTRKYRVGLAVRPVVNGTFTVELQLRGRLRSRTQRATGKVGLRFGFKKEVVAPEIKKIESCTKKTNLDSRITLLNQTILDTNQAQLIIE